jgi:hypothetical protein
MISRFVAPVALTALLMVSACVAPPAAPVMNIRMVNPWKPPRDVAGPPLSIPQQHFDFAGLNVTYNGQPMAPDAALRAESQMFSQIAARTEPGSAPPIPGTVRIVLPDHDRLRATVAPVIRNRSVAAADFNAGHAAMSAAAVGDAARRFTVKIACLR